MVHEQAFIIGAPCEFMGGPNDGLELACAMRYYKIVFPIFERCSLWDKTSGDPVNNPPMRKLVYTFVGASDEKHRNYYKYKGIEE